MSGGVATAIASGLIAGYGIAIPVGAVGTFLVALSARTSFRIGAAAGCGAATADGVYALVAVVAGTSVAGVVRPVEHPLRIAAGVALLMLAVVGAVSAVRRHRAPAAIDARRSWSHRSAYLAVLAITLLNPTTVIYFVALVLGNTAPVGSSVTAAAAFVSAVLVASTSWQLLLAGGGAALGRWLTGPRGRLITALVSSAIIVGLAGQVILG